MTNITENLNRFIFDGEKHGKLNRYYSWNIVFEDFSFSKDINFLARSLSLYLASWGMMRGSSKLLTDFSYRVHKGAVEIIVDNYTLLCDHPDRDNIDDYVDNVWNVIVELRGYYGNHGVSATDTLLSKIMLGTVASTPAYDQYFKEFLRTTNMIQAHGKKSLNQVWRYYFENISYFMEYNFPPMKLIDMIGFQYGFFKK